MAGGMAGQGATVGQSAAGRRLCRQSRRRGAGRLGLPGGRDAPDGGEFCGRWRRHQPDLPRSRSRPEGLRPGARSADRRHHGGGGARREDLRRNHGLWHGGDRRRRRSACHRRDGDRQHDGCGSDLLRPVRRRCGRLGRPRHRRRRRGAQAQARRRCRRDHPSRGQPGRPAGGSAPPRRARDRGHGRGDPGRAAQPRAGDRRWLCGQRRRRGPLRDRRDGPRPLPVRPCFGGACPPAGVAAHGQAALARPRHAAGGGHRRRTRRRHRQDRRGGSQGHGDLRNRPASRTAASPSSASRGGAVRARDR